MRNPTLVIVVLGILPMLAAAAPTPRHSSEQRAPMPTGVDVGKIERGRVYVDAHGMTLYAMSARQAGARSGVSLNYCVGPCALAWRVLRAPSGAQPVGAWSAIEGADGPQWAFKGDPVFTYVEDKVPGSAAGDGYDDLWSVIAYVPPAPELRAPATVTALFVDGSYILADPQGRAFFVAEGVPSPQWRAFNAGMASLDIGDWKISKSGDRAQWTYRGRPVFISTEETPTQVPALAVVLRPESAKPGRLDTAGTRK